MASQCKGVVVFDFLFSIIPIVLLLSLIISYSSTMSNRSLEVYQRQVVFDKLVSIADYVVKKGVAEQSWMGGEKIIYPNRVDEERLAALDVERLRMEMGLNMLSVGLEKTEEERVSCIYRLVVDGRNEIRKLYVCGG